MAKAKQKERKWMKSFKTRIHHLYYRSIEVPCADGTVKVIEKKRPINAIIFTLLFVALFVGCICFLKKPNMVALDQFGELIGALFKPSPWSLKTWNGYWGYLWQTAIPTIWLTIEMVFVATVIGIVLSIPVYILAARNVDENPVLRNIVKFLLNFLRTIPTFVLAITAAILVGFKPGAGIIAMTFFTQGVMFKMMYEYVETCDMGPWELSRSNGANKLQAYTLSLSPQVVPMLISNSIYTFEINVRASVILGFVGAGGIGALLSNAMESGQYDKVGAILIPLFVIIVALQLLSSYLRRKLS